MAYQGPCPHRRESFLVGLMLHRCHPSLGHPIRGPLPTCLQSTLTRVTGVDPRSCHEDAPTCSLTYSFVHIYSFITLLNTSAHVPIVMGHESDRPRAFPVWCRLVRRTDSNQSTSKGSKCPERGERNLAARSFDLPSSALAYLLEGGGEQL